LKHFKPNSLDLFHTNNRGQIFLFCDETYELYILV